MKYAIYVEGYEGCDYSLACGEFLKFLEADNYEDAIDEAYNLWLELVPGEEFAAYNEKKYLQDQPRHSYFRVRDGRIDVFNPITKITLIEVGSTTNLPIYDWEQYLIEKKRKEEKRIQEESERELYKSLKNRYSNE